MCSPFAESISMASVCEGIQCILGIRIRALFLVTELLITVLFTNTKPFYCIKFFIIITFYYLLRGI